MNITSSLKILTVSLCAVIIMLTGCVSNSKYESLLDDYKELLQENAELRKSVQCLETDLANLNRYYDILRGIYYELRADYRELDEELFWLKGFCPPEYFLPKK